MNSKETLHKRLVTALQRAAEAHNLSTVYEAERAIKEREKASNEQPPAPTTH